MSEFWIGLTEWVQQNLGIAPSVLDRVLRTLGLIAAYVAVRVLLHMLLERRVPDVSRRYLLRKSVSYTMGFVLVLGMLIIWFGNGTGWASYLGILSAGLAIALQDPVTNFAGWIFITVRKPFVVGDRIQVGSHSGDVIDLRLFQFTIIEIGNWVQADQSTGRLIHVPNGWVFKHSLANSTQGFQFIWHELPVVVTFESNWKRAKEILSGIAETHSLLPSHQAQEQVRRAARKYFVQYTHLTPIVWTKVVDHGVALTIRYICDPRRRRSSENAIWEDILLAFGECDDIDFAYPTMRYYHNASEGKEGARAEAPGVARSPDGGSG